MQTLATQLRPKTLAEYIGQTHLIGKNQPLHKAVETGHIFSMILWGPPGVGKTTLAQIIAAETGRPFHNLSAVSAKKSDIQKIISGTKEQKMLSESYDAPILFLDEIHRFNKAQQDFLLPFVESGEIVLIGATTENPSFEVISALLSRSKVFILNQLEETELEEVLHRALEYLGLKKSALTTQTKEWLYRYASGDARKLLTLLEHTHSLYKSLSLTNFKNTLQSNQLSYDKQGEEHYNTISAFIKSMRASNADAALYYLARMVEAGEDPKFIARRMVIFASEDIGLAAPTALVVANAVFSAVEKVGYPEAQINLAHGAAYLANCRKDRSAYSAYFSALDDVKQHGNLPIPMKLRNAPTDLMKKAGYSKGYEMYPGENINLLPKKISQKKYFRKK